MKHTIYKIENKINGKIYIGQTEYDISLRLKRHIQDSRKEYINRPLYDAFNKYGVENFTIEKIERTNQPEEREKYFIQKYNSYVGARPSNGYNATLGGGEGRLTISIPFEKIREKYYETNSIKKTAEFFNISTDTVSKKLKENKIDTSRYKENLTGQFEIKKVFCKNQKEEDGKIYSFESVTSAAKWVVEKELTKAKQTSARVSIGRAISGHRNNYLGFEWWKE